MLPPLVITGEVRLTIELLAVASVARTMGPVNHLTCHSLHYMNQQEFLM